jgi:hypothetical protein
MDLSTPAGAVRRPDPHEWRRHSLVRVRRPSWSGHESDDAPNQTENVISPQVGSSVPHTTQDDISWD